MQVTQAQECVTYMFCTVLCAEEAELIFCPYNYLLDPVVRVAMAVDIENAVLIFDEAHNIEDVCRCVPWGWSPFPQRNDYNDMMMTMNHVVPGWVIRGSIQP